MNWRHSPPQSTPQYFAVYSFSQALFSLFLPERLALARPPPNRMSLDTTSPLEATQTIASLALTGYSQCRGEPSTACLRGPNTFCSWHTCSLQGCPPFPLVRIHRQQRSFPRRPHPLHRPTIRFSSS